MPHVRGDQLPEAEKPPVDPAESASTANENDFSDESGKKNGSKKNGRNKNGSKKNGYVVIDSRGGISVDLERLLSTERGKRSIEKLRHVPVETNAEDSGDEHN